MRRRLAFVIAIVSLALFAWWSADTPPVLETPPAKPQPPRIAVEPPASPEPSAATPAPSAPAAAPAAAPASAVLSPSAGREQRAFRFVLEYGRLALEAVEDIRGDFHPRRGELPWQAGMFYCRLLDAQQRVLAEETLPAPDHVCVVLDPHLPAADGTPKAARLSPEGPVIFQVRMPRFEAAAQMKVYRLAGPRLAAAGAEPAGQLLATIPLR